VFRQRNLLKQSQRAAIAVICSADEKKFTEDRSRRQALKRPNIELTATKEYLAL